MPFSRPTLTELRTQIASDIASSVSGSDPLLRYSNLKITGDAQAGLSHLHYGYLDWIAKQAVPWTATDEYLVAWGLLKNITQKDATAAMGSVLFNGTQGYSIDSGTTVVIGNGLEYVTTASGTIDATGAVTVAAEAVSPGSAGNCSAGVTMSLATAITGVQSSGVAATAFTGGADQEDPELFRARILYAFANPIQGGAPTDYVQWSTAVPGVTRAWCFPNSFGLGTVLVYVMLDQTQAANEGFPQGQNGSATLEVRGAPATGDQLRVANAIYAVQPASPIVTVCAPLAGAVNFTMRGIPVASQAAAQSAITDLFIRDGSPGGRVPLADVWSAVSTQTNLRSFTIESPTADIVSATGTVPTLGAITFD